MNRAEEGDGNTESKSLVRYRYRYRWVHQGATDRHNRRLDISRRDAEAQREWEKREVLLLSPPRLGLLRVSPAFQAETDPSVTTEDLGRLPLALCVLASLREPSLPGHR